MAKNNNLHPSQVERESALIQVTNNSGRNAKKREQKKNQQLRQTRRLERIQRLNPDKLKQQIADLEIRKRNSNGHLRLSEEKILENLKNDLSAWEKNQRVEVNKQTTVPQEASKELGKRSIFFEPEWNPLGLAPPGFPNLSVPSKNRHRCPEASQTITINCVSLQISSIPIPPDSPPRFYKTNAVSAIENTEYKRDLLHESVNTGLLPTAVMRKQKKP